MARDIDIARAMKDKDYFNSLTAEEQARVRSESPVGEVKLDDSDLDSVSGGLEGGQATEATTTTGPGSCQCRDALQQDVVISCSC